MSRHAWYSSVHSCSFVGVHTRLLQQIQIDSPKCVYTAVYTAGLSKVLNSVGWKYHLQTQSKKTESLDLCLDLHVQLYMYQLYLNIYSCRYPLVYQLYMCVQLYTSYTYSCTQVVLPVVFQIFQFRVQLQMLDLLQSSTKFRAGTYSQHVLNFLIQYC